MDENKTAKLIYPAPVRRCKDKVTGKMIEYYTKIYGETLPSADDLFFIMKVNEELAEAAAEVASAHQFAINREDYEVYNRRTVKEIVDIISVCFSWLRCGYKLTDEEISKKFEETNKKNRARGYLDE